MAAPTRVVLGSILVSFWFSVACSNARKIDVGGTCTLNSDCNSSLVCTMGKCHEACRVTKDCPAEQSCVMVSGLGVCQLPAEARCGADLACDERLVCAGDFRCRAKCTNASVCSSGQVCAQNMCAEPSDPINGQGPGNDGGAGDGGAPVSQDAGATDAPVVQDATGTSDRDLPALGPEAGVETGLPLDTAIEVGRPDASSDTIVAVADAGCGAANQACCRANSCNPGLSCNPGPGDAGGGHCACGELGAVCCGPSSGSKMCTTGVCSGNLCGCVAGFAVTFDHYGYIKSAALRSDGTVWTVSMNGTGSDGFVEVMTGSQPLRATAVAASGETTGCALVDGGVWCFPLGDALTDSTSLGAGLSATTATSSPAQVVTSPGVGGTPLAKVTQLVGGTGQYPNFCAVTSDGYGWCWGSNGFGQLGIGGTTNINYAWKILADVGTPLRNVVEVRVGNGSGCARLADGTVWCWGNNLHGELGVPSGTLASSTTAVQVPLPTASAATRLSAGAIYTYCAIMQDSSVSCWGKNLFGQDGETATKPAPVLLAAGGRPLVGATDLAPYADGDAMCALVGDSHVLTCWGVLPSTFPYSSNPTPFQDAARNAVSGIQTPLIFNYDPNPAAGSLGYIDPTGAINLDGYVLGTQPPCTNLLP